jgi:hypothetical protein
VLVPGWVGVAVEEFFGVVGVVDLGWVGSVGPGESSGGGGVGAQVAVGGHGVVGAAGEIECVGVGASAVGPLWCVVDLAAIARDQAVGAGAAAVAGIADQSLVGGGDAFLPAQIQGAFGVVVEDGQWPW